MDKSLEDCLKIILKEKFIHIQWENIEDENLSSAKTEKDILNNISKKSKIETLFIEEVLRYIKKESPIDSLINIKTIGRNSNDQGTRIRYHDFFDRMNIDYNYEFKSETEDGQTFIGYIKENEREEVPVVTIRRDSLSIKTSSFSVSFGLKEKEFLLCP